MQNINNKQLHKAYQKYIVSQFNIHNRQIAAGDKVSIQDAFKVGFGWEWEAGLSINFWAFLLDEEGKLISDNHVVYDNSCLRLKVAHEGSDNTLAEPIEILPPKAFKEVSIESRPTDPEMSVIGDITYRTGAIPFEIKPDLQSWDINLSRTSPKVKHIVFYASIYEGQARKQTLKDRIEFVRFHYPHQKGINTEFLYLPDGDYGSCTAMELFSLTKDTNGWHIVPKGIGHKSLEEALHSL